MGLLYWMIVGLVAGWLAGQVMKGGGYGVLADIVLGVANRVASQMDVFFLGLALKPALGLFVAALSLYALAGLSREAFVGLHGWLSSWLRHG